MTALTWWLLALAVAGISFGLWQREARRRTLQHLSEMLDQAVAGGFAEERFDETALSALEGKFARFLRGSAAAKRAVEQERAAVKSLIADISHQTPHPYRQPAAVHLAAGGKRPVPSTAGTGSGPHRPGGKALLPYPGAG